MTKGLNQEVLRLPASQHNSAAADIATGGKTKRKPGKKKSVAMSDTAARISTVVKAKSGEETQDEQQQETEEEVRKAKIRDWQDAILAKSHAENPIMRATEHLKVLVNKAIDSIPSQERFDPANAITAGRDNKEIESDRALTAYVSPAHSGNKLIPTARLEVMCKQASKMMKEVGRGFFPVTSQVGIDNEGHEAPTYFLGDLFDDSHNDQSRPSKNGNSKWNLKAPLFIPYALRQQEIQVDTNNVDSEETSELEFPNEQSDDVLL